MFLRMVIRWPTTGRPYHLFERAVRMFQRPSRNGSRRKARTVHSSIRSYGGRARPDVCGRNHPWRVRRELAAAGRECRSLDEVLGSPLHAVLWLWIAGGRRGLLPSSITAARRLGMSVLGGAVSAPLLERSSSELPPLRQAMQERRISYREGAAHRPVRPSRIDSKT